MGIFPPLDEINLKYALLYTKSVLESEIDILKKENQRMRDYIKFNVDFEYCENCGSGRLTSRFIVGEGYGVAGEEFTCLDCGDVWDC